MSKTIYPTKKLGEVAQYINGRAFKPSEWGTTGLPIIRIQNLNKETASFNYCDKKIEERYHIYDGDILISWSASLGVYVWKRGEALLNQHIFKVILDESMIDKKYFVYVAKTRIAEMSSKTHGATMRHIVRSKFLNIEIPLPPLETQKKIVAKLESLLGKINEAKKLRAEAQEKTENLLSAELHKIFSEGKEKGWEEKTVDELCEVKSGGTPKKGVLEYWENGKIPWLRSGVCKDHKVERASLFITQKGLDDSSAKLLKPRTTLIALVGATIGKTGFLTFEATTNQNISGLYPKDENQLLPEYLFIIARNFYNEFLDIGKGKFKMANLTFVKKQKIPLPSLSEQKKIVARLDSLSQKVDQLKNLQKTTETELTTLEQSILHKAFNGELI